MINGDWWMGITDALYELLNEGADPNSHEVRLGFEMRDAIGGLLSPTQTAAGGRYYESEARKLAKGLRHQGRE